jgi:hypothetical protein
VIAFALAANVNPEHATSSPAPIPSTTSARWSAAVPLERRDRVRHPRDDRELRLERVDLGAERAIQFESSASATSSRSRPERWGGERKDPGHARLTLDAARGRPSGILPP